jgi:hypothetical protein
MAEAAPELGLIKAWALLPFLRLLTRVSTLDRKARRLGITRQSIIKLWVAERLERGRTAA